MTADLIFMLVPVVDLKPGEERMTCAVDSPLADFARAGDIKALHREWEVHVKMRWLHQKPRDDLDHAVVRRPRVDTQPLNPGPRYVVKLAEEMRKGEPYINSWGAVDRSVPMRWLKHQQEMGKVPPHFRCFKGHRGTYLVDTQGAEWLAFNRTHASPPTPAPAPVGPSTPADEDVVRSMQLAQQDEITPGLGWVRTGENVPKERWVLQVASGGQLFEVSRDDAAAAWSRVLAARVAASAERERMRVLVDIDDPEYA